MTTRGYTVLGWAVWKVASWFARRKLQQNRVKVGAAAVIALVIAGGVLAARAGGDS